MDRRQEAGAACRNAAIEMQEIECRLRELAEELPDDLAWAQMDIGLSNVGKAAANLHRAADFYYREEERA